MDISCCAVRIEFSMILNKFQVYMHSCTQHSCAFCNNNDALELNILDVCLLVDGWLDGCMSNDILHQIQNKECFVLAFNYKIFGVNT